MADLSVKLPKPKYGQVVVLQKNGDEPRGHGFPLISTSCVVGRSTAADIRISSADVSLTHCIFKIDEASGEASLEVHGNETQVNGTVVDPVNTIKLDHKDVILIGGRKLRFEYLPPDYKPLPSKPISGVSSDSFNAEVVDIEENGDVADCNTEKEEEVLPEVLSTPATKRVSFGPYLSPEQFDNTLPPATPIKKGATPRRSTRYSGLKFTRSVIDPLVEEDATIESPSKEEPAIHNKECIDETIISEDADVSSLAPSSETAIVDSSPSLGIGAEFPELSNPSNLEMSVDAMSTLSDVSNIAAVPSECCSFLDEPIEEDEFGPEVVEQEEESLTQMEDTSLFSEDLIGVEIPVSAMTTSRLTNGTELLRSFTTSSLTENMGDEEEGITLSPEDMSSVKNGSIIDSTAALEVQETPVPVKTKEAQSPQVDVGEAQHLVETEKLIPVTPGPVDDIKLPEAVDFEDVANIVETSAAVVVERVEQIDIININAAGEKAMETPESSPAKTPIQSPVSDTPKADDVISKAVDTLTESPKLEGVARLLETPKSTRTTVSSVGKTPQADYTDVRGVKKLLQTPKPPPNTPKADYRDVRGVKRLLATPKAAPSTPVADYTDVEGVDLLMKTPKGALPQTSEEIKISKELPEKMAETEESKPVPETTKEIIGDEKDMEETPSEDKAVEKLASDVKERNETAEIVSESKSDEKLQEKSEVEEESATASKRGRRAVPIKTDYVSGVKRTLRIPRVPGTPKADYTNVEGIDLLMKTPKPKEIPSQIIEEEKHETLSEQAAENVVMEPTSETPLKSVESIKETKEDASVNEEKNEEVIPKIDEQETKETEAPLPRRGRRAAAANTPKADYRDVSGVKRLLKTPKAAPGTPKADYCDVEGVALLMKTPKDPLPQKDKEEKDIDVAEGLKEDVEAPLQSAETIVDTISADVVDESKATTDEQEKEAPLPRRGRRVAAAKTPNTPKADYRDVSGVKRLLKTPKVAPDTPKADYSDVEGVDLLMKTPKILDKEDKDVDVSEVLTEKVVEESTSEAHLVSNETETVIMKEDVASSVDESKTTTDEQEEAPLPRRGRRVAAAKTPNTPKADYRDVSGVKRLLKTPKVAPDTPKADYSDVEGVDLLMKTSKDPVSQTIEEEKHETVSESTPDASQESAETKEKVVNTISESSEESTVIDQQTNQVEETEIEKETTPPRRGRRLAKTNTPKADYRDVGGVKRLLKTPKAAPATPKADYSDVDGIDLLMKTPKVSEECVEAVTEESTTESSVEATETIEVVNKEEDVVAAQVEEQQPAQVEGTEEVDAKKQVAPPTRRGRKPAAAKTNMPKVDDKDAKEVQQPSKTLTAADVKDADVLTSEQEKVEEVPVPEGSPEDPAEEATPAVEANEKSNEDETKREEVAEPQSNVEQDPEEVEKEATPPRRGRRAAPKSNTPKPTGRTKRKQPSSDSDSQPESNGTVPSGSEKEEQVVEEKAKPLAKISTPKRSRRTPSIKVETPKAVRSMRGKRPSESDSAQSEEVESRPLRSKRRIEEQLTLSPVVRLQRIDVDPPTTAKVARKRASVSSGEEWGVPEEVKPVRRARGRPPKVAKSKTVEEYTATHKADESISSEDDEVTKKTTRRGAVKRATVPEAPEGKRRRGETKANKHVAAGLDDVEMLHEGKGHAADIHANHVTDEAEAKDGSPVTSVKSGRSTRAKGSLKVHFDVAETANSPVRSTRSAKKVSVQLERDPDIETLAATAKEEEEKAPAAKRSRQKKGPAESPAVPATKRTRGGKKTISEPELVKEDTSPPPPRRTRRTRNI